MMLVDEFDRVLMSANHCADAPKLWRAYQSHLGKVAPCDERAYRAYNIDLLRILLELARQPGTRAQIQGHIWLHEQETRRMAAKGKAA